MILKLQFMYTGTEIFFKTMVDEKKQISLLVPDKNGTCGNEQGQSHHYGVKIPLLLM